MTGSLAQPLLPGTSHFSWFGGDSLYKTAELLHCNTNTANSLLCCAAFCIPFVGAKEAHCNWHQIGA